MVNCHTRPQKQDVGVEAFPGGRIDGMDDKVTVTVAGLAGAGGHGPAQAAADIAQVGDGADHGLRLRPDIVDELDGLSADRAQLVLRNVLRPGACGEQQQSG